jgi:SAM-dependent methyltransferase
MKQIDKERIDNIYQDVPLEEIPWNVEAPPQALADLVESRRVSPCKTIDLGCGAGNYAIYLATRGFDVTGVDSSPTAVHIAKQNAQRKGITCTFLVADILGDLHEVTDTFDFAYDWEVLHVIFPEQRKHYVENVYRLLNPRGKYLSVCFSEDDPQFGGSGKYRKTRLGTVLYARLKANCKIFLRRSLRFLIYERLTFTRNLCHTLQTMRLWNENNLMERV